MDTTPSVTTLHVVTMPPSQQPECEGTYTCTCEHCAQERANAIERGIRVRRPLPLKRAVLAAMVIYEVRDEDGLSTARVERMGHAVESSGP